MKHLCSCGEVVDAQGDGILKIATCKNCGTYYVYNHQIVEPKEEHSSEEVLKEEIEHKVQALEKPRPAKRRADV